jgi:ABC-type dipeptide/oligopeptide/nickel transport system ATPase component
MGRQLFVRESEVGKSTDTEAHYRYVPATPEDIIANRKQLHKDADALKAENAKLRAVCNRAISIFAEHDFPDIIEELEAALAAAGLVDEEK